MGFGRAPPEAMLCTDPTFLFLFLPVPLGLYFLPFSWHRNGLLLAASILFYASGGGAFLGRIVPYEYDAVRQDAARGSADRSGSLRRSG